MRREEIRSLKRAVSRDRDADAALALLHRSIRFGHRRLALLRCMEAERMGVAIDGEALRYCQQGELGKILARASAPGKAD